jgi:hypothetical protein
LSPAPKKYDGDVRFTADESVRGYLAIIGILPSVGAGLPAVGAYATWSLAAAYIVLAAGVLFRRI